MNSYKDSNCASCGRTASALQSSFITDELVCDACLHPRPVKAGDCQRCREGKARRLYPVGKERVSVCAHCWQTVMGRPYRRPKA